jgi:ATP-binding cassette subfamily E protein 1
VSYKPQIFVPTFEGSVRDLLMMRLKDIYKNPKFNSEVIKPFRIEEIINQDVMTLSGGELQRVAMVIALGSTIFQPREYLILHE